VGAGAKRQGQLAPTTPPSGAALQTSSVMTATRAKSEQIWSGPLGDAASFTGNGVPINPNWQVAMYWSREPPPDRMRELCGRLGDEVDQAAW
jgi:hypothetical protein